MKKKYISPEMKIMEIQTAAIMAASLYADPNTSTSSQYSKQFNTTFDDDEEYAAEASADSKWNAWQ